MGSGAGRRQFLFEVDEFLAARHEVQQFVARNAALRIGADAAAAFQDREAVADRIGVMHIVRNEDHANAADPRLGDELQHDGGLVNAERRSRLVEDQHPGAEMNGARDGKALPLAAGQACRPAARDRAIVCPCCSIRDRRWHWRSRDRTASTAPSASRARGQERNCVPRSSTAPERGPDRRWRCRDRAFPSARQSAPARPRRGSLLHRGHRRQRGS